ncbi:MAG: M24 family metallopeptidase [Candidatus Hodarchaeota archaeon]
MSKQLKAIKSPPSKEELSNRLKKVRELMKEQGLDYYVCFDPVNIYYLTNFIFYVHERPFLLVIPNEGTPKMVLPLLEKAHVIDRALADLEYVDYYEFPAPQDKNWWDMFQTTITDDSEVGVESAMPLGIFNKTPGYKIVTDIVDEVRIIKTDYEIGRIVHACRVVNKGHKKLLKICRPKVLEFTLYKEVTDVMTSKIVQDIPKGNFRATQTTGAVWPPSISHEPHLIPDIFTPMEEGGPHVSIVSAQVDGYGVEVERTFFLGHVPEKAKEPFKVMFEARELAYSLVKPGMIMSKIDSSVREFITDKGYGNYIIHRTGHGLGITGHEAPYIAEGYERELLPGMVISIEPGIYIPGIGGFRHSDTVLITDEGYEKLTRVPETLEDLTIKM